jgi:hypothetical protein
MPIESTPGATIITGNAIHGYRTILLCSSLGLYAETGMKAHRSFNLKFLLSEATAITGNSYGKSRKGAESAAADLTALLDRVQDLDHPAYRPEGK